MSRAGNANTPIKYNANNVKRDHKMCAQIAYFTMPFKGLLKSLFKVYLNILFIDHLPKYPISKSPFLLAQLLFLCATSWIFHFFVWDKRQIKGERNGILI